MVCLLIVYYNILTIDLISTTVLIVLITLSSILIGGIMPLVERKFLAVLQRRVGPIIVGHKGRMQFIADAVKLFIKEPIYLNNVNKTFLVLFPLSFLILNLLTPIIIVWGGNKALYNVEYDIIIILLVMLLSNIIIIYTGLILKNKYTQLSATRAAVISINMEITLSFVVNYIIMCIGSFSINIVLKLKTQLPPLTIFCAIIIPIILITLMDLGKAPFDLVEAETELVMGFHSDYSGFTFVIFLLGEYLHIAIMSYFLGILII